MATGSRQQEKGAFKLILGNNCLPQVQDKNGFVTWDPSKLKKDLFTKSRDTLSNN